jgi:hypothetical protein
MRLGTATRSEVQDQSLTSVLSQFGSKQSSPQFKDGTLKGGRYDGTDDAFSPLFGGALSPPIHAGPAQHHTLRASEHNPYFEHAVRADTSPNMTPLKHLSATERSASHQASTPSSMRSASPASMVGNFPPFAGTSPNEFPYRSPHMSERFPFANPETHTATAIRG